MIETDLSQESVVITETDLISQWKNVLRLGVADAVILTDGAGMEAEGVIESLDKKRAVVNITSRTEISREPKRSVTLYAALIRRENFELIVQKATEVGVTKIVPLLTSRTVKTGYNGERLVKIAKEACEQSGRTRMPEITEPLRFEDAVSEAKHGQSFIFHVSQTPASNGLGSGDANLFIGPEGGFTDEEISFAEKAGLKTRSLGTLTLRAETAAIVASYIACNS